jgi:hypothetical protein
LTKSSAVWATSRQPWSIVRAWPRFGIFKGLEDLGRDLLAEKANGVEMIQCKRWSQAKVIQRRRGGLEVTELDGAGLPQRPAPFSFLVRSETVNN